MEIQMIHITYFILFLHPCLGWLPLTAKAHSCNPPAGHKYAQKSLPNGMESRNRSIKTTKLPLMMPCSPALMISAGLK